MGNWGAMVLIFQGLFRPGLNKHNTYKLKFYCTHKVKGIVYKRESLFCTELLDVLFMYLNDFSSMVDNTSQFSKLDFHC